MQLDYRKTFLLGFGFFGISLIWSVYNSYVPIFLREYRLPLWLVGAIMTFDNIAGVTIQPYVGFPKRPYAQPFRKTHALSDDRCTYCSLLLCLDSCIASPAPRFSLAPDGDHHYEHRHGYLPYAHRGSNARYHSFTIAQQS